jgi:hypothetical protein
LSLEKQKKITIIECGEQSFQENRESFLDYISERKLICSLSVDKIKAAHEINYFKPKDFYKKSLRFFDSGIKR